MPNYTVVEYQFGTGQTIEAAIKFVNLNELTPEELSLLVKDYTILNGNTVPRLGDTVHIPVLPGNIDANPKFTTIEVTL